MPELQERNTNGISVESLEQRYRHLDREVGSLREDVASHGTMLSQMNTTLQEIARSVHAPRQTNWQAMIAAASLVFMMAAAYTTLSVRPISDGLAAVVDRQARSLEQGAYQQNEYSKLVGASEARMARAEAELAEDDRTIGELMHLLNTVDRRLGFIEGRIGGNADGK